MFARTTFSAKACTLVTLSRASFGIMAFSIMAFGIMAFGIMAFGIMAFIIMAFGIMAFVIMAFGIMAFGIMTFGQMTFSGLALSRLAYSFTTFDKMLLRIIIFSIIKIWRKIFCRQTRNRTAISVQYIVSRTAFNSI